MFSVHRGSRHYSTTITLTLFLAYADKPSVCSNHIQVWTRTVTAGSTLQATSKSTDARANDRPRDLCMQEQRLERVGMP